MSDNSPAGIVSVFSVFVCLCAHLLWCVTLRLCCVVEMSISSSTMLSILEVGLHWILSSSCFCSLSATIWMASVHSSLDTQRGTSLWLNSALFTQNFTNSTSALVQTEEEKRKINKRKKKKEEEEEIRIKSIKHWFWFPRKWRLDSLYFWVKNKQFTEYHWGFHIHIHLEYIS